MYLFNMKHITFLLSYNIYRDRCYTDEVEIFSDAQPMLYFETSIDKYLDFYKNKNSILNATTLTTTNKK